MTDGAHLGVGAERALKTILGGEPQPAPEERQTAEQMRDEILATTVDPHTYGGTANYAAKLILEWLLADPLRAQGPAENVYDNGPDGQMLWVDGHAVVKERGWYDLMKADGIALDTLDLTGFMWGWAVNAARRCLELPPVPNPAII